MLSLTSLGPGCQEGEPVGIVGMMGYAFQEDYFVDSKFKGATWEEVSIRKLKHTRPMGFLS